MKIIIVGKAAAGKDYLKRRLTQKNLTAGISHTTRPIRPGEQDGVDYHFVTKPEFMKLVESGQFLEYTEFRGWMYGTHVETFQNSDVLIMNKSGLDQLNSEVLDSCVVIYLDISLTSRMARLEERNDKDDDMMRRIETDENQFKDFNNFDIRITNSNF